MLLIATPDIHNEHYKSNYKYIYTTHPLRHPMADTPYHSIVVRNEPGRPGTSAYSKTPQSGSLCYSRIAPIKLCVQGSAVEHGKKGECVRR